MDKITRLEIKKGIKLHCINTSNKFKTNLISVFLTSDLSKETVTKKALLLAVLRRGNNTLKSQEEINKKLEELYGANLDCGVDKNGDNHVSKFYMETINSNYVLENENLLKESLYVLLDIVFNPITRNGKFEEEYFKSEKENLKQIIESRKDNKRSYSTIRCIEEMYKDEPYGLYKYGYVEDLDKITNEELYKTYNELISNSKIDIFVSGNINAEEVKDAICSNSNIIKLQERSYEVIDIPNNIKELQVKPVIEKTNVAQGNLDIGIKIEPISQEDKTKVAVYNAILGGGANSKLFQNVREKASLAYSAGSMYIKTKNAIIIKCGIDPENYDRTLEIVKKQIKDMEEGNFSQGDIKKAEELLCANYRSIQDEQDSEITFYFAQELNNSKMSPEDYIEKVKKVTKGDIEKIASKIKVSTIYFLTKEENANE